MVELVVAVDREFGVSIPDAQYDRVPTVGDVVELVARRLEAEGRAVDAEAIFVAVRRLCFEMTGVAKGKIRRESRFVGELGC